MNKFLQNKYSLSPEGAKKMSKGVIYSALLNISFMLPMMIVFLFLDESLNIYKFHTQARYTPIYYIILVPLIIVCIYLANRLQYDSVYTTTYTEIAKKRISLSEHMRKLPLSFFNKRDLSDLTATIMSDMESMEHAYSHSVPQFYGNIISVCLIGLMIASMNVKMAIALMWPFPLGLALIFAARNKMIRLEKIHHDEKLKVSDSIQEILENILPIKGYQRQEKTLDEFKIQLDEEEEKHLKAEISIPLMLGPISSLLRLGVLSSILVGIGQYTSGGLSLAQYLGLLIACLVIYSPMDACLAFIIEFMLVQIPNERMKEIFNAELMTGQDVDINNFDIELKNVTFGYDDTMVIKDVSFLAKQGQTTALVGPSGCGKSTLTKLMLRFWDVNSGQIKLGGVDIRDIDPESLLKHYSMVFQDVILFNNTIMENIRIGKKNATDQEVMEAAKIAQLDDFIQTLPDGYMTKIGENGALLSGGERQRISIARAILKDAPIIFLDESTSSVDADNETKIQEALSKLIKNKTVIIIAHRLRTVENADQIIVLDEGRIVEEGSSDELIANQGLFYKLWKTQKQ